MTPQRPAPDDLGPADDVSLTVAIGAVVIVLCGILFAVAVVYLAIAAAVSWLT